MRESTAARSLTSSVRDLLAAVTGLVKSVGNAVASSPGVAAETARVKRSAKRVGAAATEKGRKVASSLKSYWARLTPAEKKKRVNAILRGRGLLGRKKGGADKSAKAPAKSSKPRKNPWDSMTPEQRADRIRKMQAGRR